MHVRSSALNEFRPIRYSAYKIAVFLFTANCLPYINLIYGKD